ncbi:sulfatase-like hydrolase/transferase [Niabella ginsengisoli]|uniref:Sulfatase-like hydrolase/transferase n=1 Tax=Niabella ginsengisoli TaxID=522298 RepID=A0ABS9SIS5_9BACT|nr:sulfatase-like hydrolase/transferase [Niabella ginsengisoli]MCH5598206.1 sulfatase-like hydrolase/transferase [Niabella ginsengisoli]
MMRNFFIVSLTLIFSFSLNAQKKNIVLILSDDAGYADFGFQSSRFIPTPNIDKIAMEGAKFTNAYVTGAVCSPSRAGLLTGINQPEFGTIHNYIKGGKYNITQDEYGIPQHVKLVGDYLKPLGYKCGIVGKWHEGFSKPFHPNTRGFDYFWGFLWGSSNYFTGTAVEVQENGTPVDPKNIPYMTDAIADKTIAFIEREKDHPFFVYVSFNAIHTPQESKKEHLELFLDKYSDDKRKLQNAAMTHSLDENVGKILDKLEQLGLKENTIVIFTNDNGGQVKVNHADNFPLRGMKGDAYEGGIRVPMAICWPGKIKPGTVSDGIASSLDFLPTFLEAACENPNIYKALRGHSLVDIALNESRYKKEHYTGSSARIKALSEMEIGNLFYYLEKARNCTI